MGKEDTDISNYFAQESFGRPEILDFSILDLSILDSDTLYSGILDSGIPDLTSCTMIS